MNQVEILHALLQLVERLEESGWKDQVRMACKDVVKERGLDKITVEDLVQVHTLHWAAMH